MRASRAGFSGEITSKVRPGLGGRITLRWRGKVEAEGVGLTYSEETSESSFRNVRQEDLKLASLK